MSRGFRGAEVNTLLLYFVRTWCDVGQCINSNPSPFPSNRYPYKSTAPIYHPFTLTSFPSKFPLTLLRVTHPSFPQTTRSLARDVRSRSLFYVYTPRILQGFMLRFFLHCLFLVFQHIGYHKRQSASLTKDS